MSGRNGTVQFKDNQSPTAADTDMGRMFWDNTQNKFRQIDDTGTIADVGSSGSVNTVVGGTDITIDNTDSSNPIVNFTGSAGGTVDAVVGGTDITVDATDPANPIVNFTGSAGGTVDTVVGGTDVTVDATDPANPIVNFTGSTGTVDAVVGGTDITVDATDPANPIVNFTGNVGTVDSVVGGTDITVDATDPENPIVNFTGSTGTVDAVVGGTDITVDATDPENPIVNFTGNLGTVDSVVGGTKITVDATDPENPIANFDGLAHNELSGLTAGDDHTQYALLAGRSGGQTLNGGTAASDDININTTSNATKGELNVDGIAMKQAVLNANHTGLLDGGTLSVNADNTLFDISDGSGYVIDNTTDPSNPAYTKVTWTGLTGLTVDNLLTAPRSEIAIDSSSTVVQQTTPFTVEQCRTLIVLGRLVHSNQTNLSFTLGTPTVAFNSALQNGDLASTIGPVNRTGNVYSANGSNMNLDKSAGETYRVGTNYVNDKQNPNITTDPSGSAISFAYRYQDGSGGIAQGAFGNTVDPTLWDDGSGTLQAVPTSDWTVQRIYYFGATNTTFIMPGQAVYSNNSNAEAAIFSEEFNADPNLVEATFRGWLLLRQNCNDLTSGRCQFITADKFGSTAVAGATSSTTTLQQAYTNSDVDPEILLDSTNGAIGIRSASGSDAANALEIQENAGTANFTVTGEGSVTAKDLTIDAASNIDVVGAGAVSLMASAGANNVTVGGATSNVVIPGDLEVQGTTTTINTANLDVADANVTVNSGGTDGSSEGAGLTIERVGTDGSLVYEDTLASKFKIGPLGSEVEIADVSSAQTLINKSIVATQIDSGILPDARIQSSGVTQHEADLSIAASQLTGTLADARITSGNVTQHEADLSIAASQLTGTLADARITSGNVTQHQDDITSVGTLDELNISGDITAATNKFHMSDASGRLGIGTLTPESFLHVVSGA